VSSERGGARLVLASGSPRRRELLARLGVEFDVRPPDVDETPIEAEDPRRYVARLARAKATSVARADGETVIGADTTIEIDGEVVGKPADAGDAESTLERLAGRRHHVHTGLSIRFGDEVVVGHVTTTAVDMVSYDPVLIAWYVSTGEPIGKAGAYALQGRGEVLVAGVEGSVSNVIGLPLASLVELLAATGWQWEVSR
jgi:septum formation protein